MEVKEQYYFIVNRKSKTGKAAEIWRELEQVLKERKVPYHAYTTKYYRHATELADQICSKPGKINLVVVGGDGTVNEVLNGMHDFDRVTFGCIPSGSANDFARGFGLAGTPREILERMLDAKEEEYLDFGQVTYGEEGLTRRFIVSSGVGVDADVCRQALDAPIKKVLNRFHLGQLTYVVLTVKTLFTMPLMEAEVRAENGTIYRQKKAIFIAAMNFPYEGGGVPMAPKASAFDGKLSCCCVHDIPRLLCFFLLPVLCLGKHTRLRGFDIIESRKLEVTLKSPAVVHADGEDCGDQKKLCFEAVSGQLRVKKI